MVQKYFLILFTLNLLFKKTSTECILNKLIQVGSLVKVKKVIEEEIFNLPSSVDNFMNSDYQIIQNNSDDFLLETNSNYVIQCEKENEKIKIGNINVLFKYNKIACFEDICAFQNDGEKCEKVSQPYSCVYIDPRFMDYCMIPDLYLSVFTQLQDNKSLKPVSNIYKGGVVSLYRTNNIEEKFFCRNNKLSPLSLEQNIKHCFDLDQYQQIVTYENKERHSCRNSDQLIKIGNILYKFVHVRCINLKTILTNNQAADEAVECVDSTNKNFIPLTNILFTSDSTDEKIKLNHTLGEVAGIVETTNIDVKCDKSAVNFVLKATIEGNTVKFYEISNNYITTEVIKQSDVDTICNNFCSIDTNKLEGKPFLYNEENGYYYCKENKIVYVDGYKYITAKVYCLGVDLFYKDDHSDEREYFTDFQCVGFIKLYQFRKQFLRFN